MILCKVTLMLALHLTTFQVEKFKVTISHLSPDGISVHSCDLGHFDYRGYKTLSTLL